MSSELDYHELTSERDVLKQQLAECQAARGRAEAEAGMLRGLVSSAIGYISMEHEWSTDQADVWLSIATTALATDAGEKAAEVIAAARAFWRDRTQRVGPLNPHVADRLLAAVAAMEESDE